MKFYQPYSVVLAAFLLVYLPLSAGQWPKIMHAYRGSTPTLDGVVTPGEWEDAVSFEGTDCWMHQYSSTTDSNDLFVKGYIKHDGHDLYLAFDVTDDVLYGIETERWLPKENAKAHDFSRESFPWFGDGVELLINAAYQWSQEDKQFNSGTGSSWQMVCNATKSLLGGIGKGGLIQGENRSNETAWNNYTDWIKTGAMLAAVQIKPDRSGFVIEWKIKPNPCLEVRPGQFWSPEMGSVKMGLNLGVQDLDEKEKSSSSEFGFHREDWWAGEKDKRTWLKQWGTLILHPEIKPKKRSNAFWGLHFDFHAQAIDQQIGQGLTAEMLDEMVRRIRPDYLQCDTKGHAGYSSYPTAVGNPAASFALDPLKLWQQVSAQHGIPLISHYSGIWDGQALAKHPQWASVDAEGKARTDMTSVFGPYADELIIPQFQELAREYGVNGAWVDGDVWALRPDYSSWAQEAWKKQYGTEMPKDDSPEHHLQLMNFWRQGYRDYLNHYTTAIKAYDSRFEMCSNWAYSSFMPEPVSIDVDYLSGDLSSTDAVNAARFESRIFRSQNKPWDLMAWSFYYDFTPGCAFNPKTALQLQQEVAGVLCQGGGVSIYCRQPNGLPIPWQFDSMAQVADFVLARKEFCFETQPVPQVALLYSQEALYHNLSYALPFGFGDGTNLSNDLKIATQGILNCLLDAQFSVEIHMEHTLAGKMEQYPVIVVPEWHYLDPNLVGRLTEYARAGGHLVVVGPQAARLFEDSAGFESQGEIRQPDPRFLAYAETMAGFVASYQAVIPGANTTVIGHLYPNMEKNGEPLPAATRTRCGQGTITAVHFALGQKYYSHRNDLMRNYLEDLVQAVWPNRMVKVTGSHNVDVSINRKGDRLLINLLNTAGPHENRMHHVFDAIPPVGPLNLQIHMDKKPRQVLLQPAQQQLKFKFKDHTVYVTVDKLDVHAVLEIR